MKTYKEFLAEHHVEYLVVSMPKSAIESLELITEGGWRDAHINGWKYRVDPERPELHQTRHVHVAQAKHTAAKRQQAAWNIDGTRHDAHNFNATTGSLSAARSVACRALGIADDALLEERNVRLLVEAKVMGEISKAQFFFDLKVE